MFLDDGASKDKPMDDNASRMDEARHYNGIPVHECACARCVAVETGHRERLEAILKAFRTKAIVLEGRTR